jgi:hypothetical protein
MPCDKRGVAEVPRREGLALPQNSSLMTREKSKPQYLTKHLAQKEQDFSRN